MSTVTKHKEFINHLASLDDIATRIENVTYNLTYMMEAMSSRKLDDTITCGVNCAIDLLTILQERMGNEVSAMFAEAKEGSV